MGVVSTYIHVPFIRIQKPVISQSDLVELERLYETLTDTRCQCLTSGETELSFAISDCRQLLSLLEQCQSEYAGNLLDLSIHLSMSCGDELGKMIDKIRQSLVAPTT